MKRIAVILYGDIKYDNRVKKEIASLMKNNFIVTLLIPSLNQNDDENNYNFIIKNFKMKESKSKIGILKRMILFNIKVIKYLRDNQFDYIHFNDINVTLFSNFLKKRSKLIFDLHELYPESLNSFLAKKFFDLIEKITIKNANQIIQPEVNRMNYFMKKHNLPIEKFSLIENFPLRISFKNRNYFQRKYNEISFKNKKIAIYTGVLGENRGILEIIKAIEDMDEIYLFCFGKFINKEYQEKILKYIENKNLNKRIFFEKMVEYKELLELTNSADIGFIFYQNSNLNNYYCASNKLYEALNYGVKILTNDYPGIKTVTYKLPNVYRIKKFETLEIKKGIKSLLKEEKVIKTDYYWENQEEEFIKIYSEN